MGKMFQNGQTASEGVLPYDERCWLFIAKKNNYFEKLIF